MVGRNQPRGERQLPKSVRPEVTADFIPTDLRDTPSAREVARSGVELGKGQVAQIRADFVFEIDLPNE